MKNILLAKIGQKIIFNREDELVNRDNSNGNFELYVTIKLLAENSTDTNFYVISNNDLLETQHKPINLNDISKSSVDKYDAIIVFAGLLEYEKSQELYNIINDKKLSKKFILISTDPRCLESTLIDKRLTRKPDRILSQFEGEYIHNNNIYNVEYVPLETATSYKHKVSKTKESFSNKTNELVVIANSSAKEYNRIGKVSNLLKLLDNIKIYGRVFDDEVHLLNKQDYKGSVRYDKIPGILESSIFTLIVPVDKDMITSKYVESLMYNCIPVFYKDYNTELLKKIYPSVADLINFLTIRDSEELNKFMIYINAKSPYFLTQLHNELYKTLIKPFIDGSKLSKEIMRRTL